VIILDENIPDSQRQLLRSWRIQASQVGHEVGRQGIKDEEIIPLLHQLKAVTFFTRDIGFYNRHLCHADYCLVCLAVNQYEVASFVRRFLKHPDFNTKAKRMGKVIRLTHIGLQVWRLHAQKEEDIKWKP
jgi:hypothetical protein